MNALAFCFKLVTHTLWHATHARPRRSILLLAPQTWQRSFRCEQDENTRSEASAHHRSERTHANANARPQSHRIYATTDFVTQAVNISYHPKPNTDSQFADDEGEGGPEPGTEKLELLSAPDGNKSIPAVDFECDSTSQRRTFVYVSCSICSFSTASVREASFLECATSCVSSSCSRPIESPVLSRRIRLCAVHVLASPQSRLPG